MKLRSTFVLVALLAAPAVASAQWSDNFDSYANGTVMDNVGGWAGWDNTPSAAGVISNAVSVSSPNSMSIPAAADAVYAFSGVDSGVWTISAQQFIPRDFSGSTYFILLNTYAVGGPNDWSSQLIFNSTTGTVTDDNRPGSTVQFVRDAWAEIRVEIDLDADTMSAFYNNQLVSSGTWTTGATSATSIGAIDLFGNNASTVFYDDISLIPTPGAAGLLGLAGLAAMRRRR